jgi:hypothetical protein
MQARWETEHDLSQLLTNRPGHSSLDELGIVAEFVERGEYPAVKWCRCRSFERQCENPSEDLLPRADLRSRNRPASRI